MNENCISFGEGTERCSSPAFLGSKFCGKHLRSCIPAYLRYKKREIRIGPWPSIPTAKVILSRYKRLKDVYDLRKSFQMKHIHPSERDSGHFIHLEKIEKEMNVCLQFLKDEINKKNVETLESGEDIEIESESEEERNVTIPYNKQEIPIDRSNKEKFEDITIITPAEEVSSLLGVNSDFILFFMSNIYPLIASLRLSLGESSYVRKSPLRKLSIIPHEDIKSEIGDVLDFFIIEGTSVNFLLKYFMKIYEEGKERGYLLYRYYRSFQDCYSLTFISNESPCIINILDIPFPIICSLENEDDLRRISETPIICSYREPFGKTFDIVVEKSEEKRAFGIYSLLIFDVYKTGDYSPWITLNKHLIGGIGLPLNGHRIYYFAKLMHSKGYFLLH